MNDNDVVMADVGTPETTTRQTGSTTETTQDEQTKRTKIREVIMEQIKAKQMYDEWCEFYTEKARQSILDVLVDFLSQGSQDDAVWRQKFLFKFSSLEDVVQVATINDAARSIFEICLVNGLVGRANKQSRLAEITHGLDSTYFGRFDLNEFVRRINDAFQWYNGDHQNYVSPSFALVQSSGMGKTKLMKQYKQLMKQYYQATQNTFDVFMLLCHDGGATLPDDFLEHFDGPLNVPAITSEGHRENGRKKIIDQLETYLSNSEFDNVVILIDEAQLLTSEAQGGLYVSMRWWLRQKRTKRVVAVFAGTLLSLANYQHVKPPLGWTRDANAEYLNYEGGDNYKEHRQQYNPFFTLTTMAIDHAIKKNNLDLFTKRNPPMETEGRDDALHDIRRCGYYGRPMFASLLRPDKNKGRVLELPPKFAKVESGKGEIVNKILHNALRRILLSTTSSWEKHNESLASVLATRVQMGISTYEFAERATSHGYATLVDFRHDASSDEKNKYGTASIVFPPDPVCSALAMGLMQGSWSLASGDGVGTIIQGKPGRFWVEKAASIFDHGLFLPNRGDPGEVFAALYMLLCGDELRANEDPCMRKFEIGLNAWYKSLCGESDLPESSKRLKSTHDGGDTKPQRKSPRIAKLREDQQKLKDCSKSSSPIEDDAKCYLNFIQVCRNYFRTHAWFKEAALEFMFDTGSGCYVYANCPAIDIVFTVKVMLKNGGFKYHPVLVSVKCWDAIGGADMQQAMDAMKAYLQNYRDETDKQTTALCLLIVVGAQSVGSLPAAEGSFPSEDTFVPIVVPANDKFGVHQVIVQRATSTSRAEVLASHPYAHVEDSNYDSLRSKTSSENRIFGENLLTEKLDLGLTEKLDLGAQVQDTINS